MSGEFQYKKGDIKYCKWCGTEISNRYAEGTNEFRHCALQYCPDCRNLSDKQKNRLRVHNFRQRKKQKEQFRDKELVLLQERLEILQQENELLRSRLIEEREKR